MESSKLLHVSQIFEGGTVVLAGYHPRLGLTTAYSFRRFYHLHKFYNKFCSKPRLFKKHDLKTNSTFKYHSTDQPKLGAVSKYSKHNYSKYANLECTRIEGVSEPPCLKPRCHPLLLKVIAPKIEVLDQILSEQPNNMSHDFAHLYENCEVPYHPS